jgi:hypothetical protein
MGPYAKRNYLAEEITAFFPEYVFFLDDFYQGETGFLHIRQPSFNTSS